MDGFIKIENCSKVIIDNCSVHGIETLLEVDKSSSVTIKNSNFNKKIDNKEFRINKIDKYKRNDKCYCASGKKYKKCCLEVLSKTKLEDSDNICMLVGNGLNMDVRKKYIKDDKWDSYNFFSWEIARDNKLVIDEFKELKNVLEVLDESEKNDFEKVKLIYEKSQRMMKSIDSTEVEKGEKLICETRQYVAIAFSFFQRDLEKVDINQWSWLRFLKSISNRLSYIISLNYDKTLEYALSEGNIEFSRVGIVSENRGIPILKPHGSIDFEVEGISANIENNNIIALNNDFSIKTIEGESLLKKRIEADIVLPMEKSDQRYNKWIDLGYKQIQEECKHCSHLVIMGVSYWECDREEVDIIIDSMDKDSKVTVIDPQYTINESLKKKLENRFKKENIYNIDYI